MKYEDFLTSKLPTPIFSGWDALELNKILFDFQSHIVNKAVKAGRYAIFADCGLGKTIMQLEWARHVSEKTDRPVLILAPLAVVGQTIKEGANFGYGVVRYSMEMNTMQETPNGIYIANYDQLDNINTNDFSGVVLDESSILKNFEGATRNLIMDSFKNTPYKLACTATPSPNDPMELGNHSEFLGIMPRNEVLSMYFTHDGGETAKWRLKGHSEKLFWRFVSSWAIMLSNPSDIGFNAKGYDLPKLNYVEKQLVTEKRNNGLLFNDVAISATNFNAELRVTKVERLDEVADIVNNSTETFIIWIKQNEEGEMLRKLIPDAIEVKGSDSPEFKERMLLGFADNKFRVLITKTKIAQFGLNFQNCHNQIFASLDFSFEGLYQAIRRSYRFGQKHKVNIYMITTDTMRNVIESIIKKQKQHENMQKMMQQSINDAIQHEAQKTRIDKTIVVGDATLMLGDCVQRITEIETESIGFSIFSPPFAELYTYSSELEDMGNSRNYNEFLIAFDYLVKELFRVMWTGRNVAVHCMDLPIQKGKEGFIGLRDFSNMIRIAFENAGFVYHSRVTIWKDPVVEMQRTKALGLLHKQVKKDAAMSRVGLPDYVLVFRKDGESLHPVHCDIPVDLWQKYASPVWYDIKYGNTLNRVDNSPNGDGHINQDEKHICPLQLDTIERAVHLYSNKGDTVFTPFMGIGSEVYQSVKMGRKAKGIELKESYFNVSIKNAKNCNDSKMQISLI